MKTCSMCKVSKSEIEFAKKRTKNNGEVVLQYHCRKCQKLHSAKNYKKNQRKYITNAKKRNNAKKEILIKYLVDYFSKNPCIDCGQTNPVVLEFDHVRGTKIDEISSMVRRGAPIETVIEEIHKCEVRCANCHRIATANRGNWMILKFLP